MTKQPDRSEFREIEDIHRPMSRFGCIATLYLGANIPAAAHDATVAEIAASGGLMSVTDDEFRAFLRDEVVPAFPGFTVHTSDGYWKGESERVRILVLMADDSAGFRVNVRQIAEKYKTRFCQEAVAYSFTEAQFTLNCWPYGPVGAYHRPNKGY